MHGMQQPSELGDANSYPSAPIRCSRHEKLAYLISGVMGIGVAAGAACVWRSKCQKLHMTGHNTRRCGLPKRADNSPRLVIFYCTEGVTQMTRAFADLLLALCSDMSSLNSDLNSHLEEVFESWSMCKRDRCHVWHAASQWIGRCKVISIGAN